ncbi:MAG: FISUMP domain-containing protein, partial [Bacteroidota bacterium]
MKKAFLQISIVLITLMQYPAKSQTVTDIDGNVYPTLTIGTQEWMGENLRTTRYSNGDLLLNPQMGTSWQTLAEGAWIAYDEDPQNIEFYGKLYNGHAVADPRGLCPDGWRIPTDEDWQQLTAFVDPAHWGNNNVLGTALKSRRQPNSPHGDGFATNEHPRWDTHNWRHGDDTFGFGALPGGAFVWPEGFAHKGSYAYYWSSTVAYSNHLYARVMMHSHRGMSRSVYNNQMAFSVRCIKDTETITYTLSLSVQPENTGSVQGAGNYTEGRQVDITATPADGYIFVQWTDDQGNPISTEASFAYAMPAEDISLVAVFDVEPESVVDTFPWSEDFEGSSFPPKDWSRFNLGGTFMEWQMDAVQNHSPNGAQSAFHNYGSAQDGMQNDWLVTPKIQVPADGDLQLSFWSYNAWPAWYLQNSVLVSTGSGVPEDGDFTQIWAAPYVLTSWENTILDLDAYAGQTIYIAFRYEGQDAHAWYLDDVSLNPSGTPDAFNLKLNAFPSEGGSVSGQGTYTAGEQVEITATPAQGYIFVNWTYSNGTEVSTSPAHTLTMPEEH